MSCSVNKNNGYCECLIINEKEVLLEVILSSKEKFYISHVYSDNFEDDGVKPLIEVIDKNTFVKIDDVSYKDKRHNYKLKLMHDTATLSIIDVSYKDN